MMQESRVAEQEAGYAPRYAVPPPGIAICAYLLKSASGAPAKIDFPIPFSPVFSLFVDSNFHAVIDISDIL